MQYVHDITRTERTKFLKQNKKIVKYRKPFNINIGIIIFIIIFIYLVFNVFSYVTTEHISVYEVEQGTIAENNVYRGLILRDEQVFNSDYSGALNYYVKEATKVSCNNLVYSVDESGDVSKLLSAASADTSLLSKENLDDIETSISDFQLSYDAQSFYNVYSFKDDLSSALEEALNLSALDSISDYASSAEQGNSFHRVYASEDGLVVYYTDGYENVTTDNFTADMFEEANYSKVTTKNSHSINAGDAAYKIIHSEIWNIVVPIEESVATELADDNVLQLRFVQDDKTSYAYYSIEQRDGSYYLILSLRSGMVRYAKERFIEIELLLNEETGLKIPNSAITEKEFYTVPIEYFMKGGDSSDEGLLVQSTDSNGDKITEFVAPTIYYETDEYYYIDGEDVSAEDVVLKSDSSATYTIGSNTAVLQGVYNINKGYAVFKQIDILYQNEEYTIVKTGTTYGVALYDHIALDGTKIHENDLIK